MRFAARLDARLVVGIGGPDVSAHLEDLSLPEGRMKRVGCAQKLDRRTHADGALFGAFDHCRADHELVVRARNDVERNARMQKTHRARQRHLARADAHHFAAHAAQLRKRFAGRPAAAIDNDVRVARRFAIDAKTDLAAFCAQAVGQRRQGDARIEMAFVGEEQALAETPREIRLQLRNARFVHPHMRLRPRREAVDLTDVARRRDNQRALARITPGTRASHQSIAPWPSSTTLLGRALALAERSEHAAREPRRVAAELARALNQRDFGAPLGERNRGRQADDASANDSRAHRLIPPHRRRALRPCPGIRGTSPPCRPSPRLLCEDPG